MHARLNTSFSFSCPSCISGPYSNMYPEAPSTLSHVAFMVLWVTSSNWRPVTEGRATTLTHKDFNQRPINRNTKLHTTPVIHELLLTLQQESVLKRYLSGLTSAGLMPLLHFDLWYCKPTCCFWSSQSFARLVCIDSKHSQLVLRQRAEMA